MKTILLGKILNKNTSLRKSLGPFTNVLYDVEKSIPFNLRYNFYNNLSSDGIFFFWIIVFLFIFLIISSVTSKFSNSHSKEFDNW